MLLALSALHVAGCASFGRVPPGVAPPLRLSDVADRGDPARRASMRLVLQGLDEDVALRPASALVLYERALQVDPTNPYAYLALARHQLEAGEPRRALDVLDQCEALLQVQGRPPPGAEAHVLGLRGAALQALQNRSASEPLLARAAELAPQVWSDGRLSAAELR